jgi:hypothetical protein
VLLYYNKKIALKYINKNIVQDKTRQMSFIIEITNEIYNEFEFHNSDIEIEIIYLYEKYIVRIKQDDQMGEFSIQSTDILLELLKEYYTRILQTVNIYIKLQSDMQIMQMRSRLFRETTANIKTVLDIYREINSRKNASTYTQSLLDNNKNNLDVFPYEIKESIYKFLT